MIELSIEVGGEPEGLAALLDRVSKACCSAEGIAEAAAFARLVDDAEIQRINREFRRMDKPTDVLSFPSICYKRGKTARDCPKRLSRERDPDSGLSYLGDFVISLPTARRQARDYGHPLKRELCYLAAHALLHLMGYDHETDEDKRAMRAMEERALSALGIGREPDMTDKQLFELACDQLQRAYAPYSGFKVGACILSSDGRAFTGCNVENASYGATICAERGAVMNAVSQGATRFTKIAVATENQIGWPCGVCRQVLFEFSENLQVISGNAATGEFVCVALDELLPRAFGPKDLQ